MAVSAPAGVGLLGSCRSTDRRGEEDHERCRLLMAVAAGEHRRDHRRTAAALRRPGALRPAVPDLPHPSPAVVAERAPCRSRPGDVAPPATRREGARLRTHHPSGRGPGRPPAHARRPRAPCPVDAVADRAREVHRPSHGPRLTPSRRTFHRPRAGRAPGRAAPRHRRAARTLRPGRAGPPHRGPEADGQRRGRELDLRERPVRGGRARGRRSLPRRRGGQHAHLGRHHLPRRRDPALAARDLRGHETGPGRRRQLPAGRLRRPTARPRRGDARGEFERRRGLLRAGDRRDLLPGHRAAEPPRRQGTRPGRIRRVTAGLPCRDRAGRPGRGHARHVPAPADRDAAATAHGSGDLVRVADAPQPTGPGRRGPRPRGGHARPRRHGRAVPPQRGDPQRLRHPQRDGRWRDRAGPEGRPPGHRRPGRPGRQRRRAPRDDGGAGHPPGRGDRGAGDPDAAPGRSSRAPSTSEAPL